MRLKAYSKISNVFYAYKSTWVFSFCIKPNLNILQSFQSKIFKAKSFQNNN